MSAENGSGIMTSVGHVSYCQCACCQRLTFELNGKPRGARYFVFVVLVFGVSTSLERPNGKTSLRCSPACTIVIPDGIHDSYNTVAARYSGNYHIRSSRKIFISPGTEETVGVLSKPACG